MSNLRLFILSSLLAMSCLGLKAEQRTDSVRVHFRLNEASIDTMYMNNAEAMQSFLRRLSQFDVELQHVHICGATSPEGSIPYNMELSRKRAAAIESWLRGHVAFADSIASCEPKGRDWRELQSRVEADPETPCRYEVLALIGQGNLAGLMTLDAGRPYRYLLAKHFPALRAAEVVIAAPIEQTDACTAEACCNQAEETDTIAVVFDAPVCVVPDSIVAPAPGGYQFGLKTNMLYDAALIPNLGVEFPIGRHLSVGANWMYAWWHNQAKNRQWRIYGGDVNARYYFGRTHRGASLQGHHVGVYAQVLVFQVAFGGKGYITGIPGQNLWGKPWLGGGIEYGYSKRIAKRLNIDFTLGLGYLGGEYLTYRPVDDHYVWQSSHRNHWFGPTKAEISLVWLIGKEGTR